MVITGGHHRRHVIELLREEKGFFWTSDHFCERLVMRIAGLDFKSVEAIKLREVSVTSIANVRKAAFFLDNMRALIIYEGSFYQQYGNEFPDGRARDTVNDTVYSEQLTTRSMTIYNR